MNKRFLVLFASLLTASFAFAAEPYKGEVQKVDGSGGKVTLKHGPIAKFGMEEGMTMVYRVKDPSMLTGLKAGDEISFDTDKIDGKYTITKIEKKK